MGAIGLTDVVEFEAYLSHLFIKYCYWMEIFLNQPHWCKFHARPLNNNTVYDYQDKGEVCQAKNNKMGITDMIGAWCGNRPRITTPYLSGVGAT